MVHNQQRNHVIIGYDPGYDPGTDSAHIRYIVRTSSTAPCFSPISSNANPYNSCNSCNSWGDSSFFSSIEPKFNSRLTHVFAKFLSDAEKAYLRKINFQPTRDGINVCCTWHDRSTHWISSMPQLQARFDRRILCWRAGRFKSLT